MGGTFRTSSTAVSNYVARFNADGTPDTAFNSNAAALFNASVEDLAVASDGKIVVVGGFTTVAGAGGGCQWVARLNTDGTLDTTFCTNYANALSARGNSVAIRSSDGAIVIGSNSTTPSSYVAMLNSDGTPNSTFNTSLGVTLKQSVYAVGLNSTGMVYAGGASALLGAGTGSVAAINADGTTNGDAGTFNAGFGTQVTSTVYAVGVQSNDKVVVGGGYFASLGSSVARFNTDGTADAAFNTNAAGVDLVSVQDLTIDSSGRIPVVGSFAQRLTRLLATGASDTSFADPGVSDGTAYAVATTTNSKLLLGGSFTTVSRYLGRFYGEAAAGPLTFSSGAFPAATVGSASTLTVTVTNSGAGSATPSAITVAGSGVINAGTGTCSTSSAIAASGTCTVVLTWTPSAAGSLSAASLTIAYPNGATASNAVTLTGTATASGGGGGSSGGSSSEPTPTPSPTPSTTPAVLPPLDPQGSASGLRPGQDAASVGGQAVPVVVAPNGSNTGLDVSSAGWRLSLSARTASGAPAPLGPNGVLRFVRGQGLATEGVGFRPNSPVTLYLFSDAVLLGELTTDASGSFSGTVPLPADVALGAHVAQVNGYTAGGEVRSVSLGVEVVAAATTSTSVGSRVYFPYESAKLTAKAKRTLRSLVAQVPDQASASSVVVGVVRAKGQKPSDRVLAKARAANVSRYLKAAGLPGTVSVTTRSVTVRNVAEARRVLVTVRYTG